MQITLLFDLPPQIDGARGRVLEVMRGSGVIEAATVVTHSAESGWDGLRPRNSAISTGLTYSAWRPRRKPIILSVTCRVSPGEGSPFLYICLFLQEKYHSFNMHSTLQQPCQDLLALSHNLMT